LLEDKVQELLDDLFSKWLRDIEDALTDTILQSASDIR